MEMAGVVLPNEIGEGVPDRFRIVPRRNQDRDIGPMLQRRPDLVGLLVGLPKSGPQQDQIGDGEER
jgi:hypothetical protein